MPKKDSHGCVIEYTADGVTLQPFDRYLHGSQTQSWQFPDKCAQGGQDTCPKPPEFSITSKAWSISACTHHVYGALNQARTMNQLKAS